MNMDPHRNKLYPQVFVLLYPAFPAAVGGQPGPQVIQPALGMDRALGLRLHALRALAVFTVRSRRDPSLSVICPCRETHVPRCMQRTCLHNGLARGSAGFVRAL